MQGAGRVRCHPKPDETLSLGAYNITVFGGGFVMFEPPIAGIFLAVNSTAQKMKLSIENLFT